MSKERHDRQVRFFMKEGQDRLSTTKVAIVGVGGLAHMLSSSWRSWGLEA